MISSPSMRYILLTVFIFSIQNLVGQNLLVNTSDQDLVSFDVNGCSTSTLVNIGSYRDIASHPDGFIYGVRGNGQIFRINPTTGNATLFNTFPFDECNALTSDASGNIFCAGGGGELSSYDPNTDIMTNYPNMGFGASGDLTFYQGIMYMATNDNTMVSIDPANPQNNEVFIDFSSSGATIFGIVSNVDGCDINTYAFSNDFSARVYEIDWINQSFNFVCTIPHRVYGGSSQFEFDASIEVIEVSEVIIENNGCSEPDNEVTVIANSGNGDLIYSLDGVNFQQNNSFQNLDFGFHTIFMEDVEGCTGQVDLEIEAASITIDEVISTASGCTIPNTYVEVIASGSNSTLMYSIDDVNYQTSNIFQNLPFGDYIIYVNDGQNCTAETTVSLNSNSIIIDEVISFSSGCDVPSTYVEVIASSDNGGLMYSADGINFQPENIFSNLVFGNYTISIQDAGGCTAATDVTLNPGSIDIVDVISNSAGCTEPDTYIEVVANSSAGGISYSADGTTFQQSNIFENLDFGDQIIYLEDADGCQTNIQVNLSPGFLNITNIMVSPASCNSNNGELVVDVASSSNDILYSLDGENFSLENVFTDLAPGDYQLIVRDTTTCIVETPVIIEDNTSFEILNVVATTTTCDQANGSITINTLDNGNEVLYSLDDITYTESNSFQNLPNGNYTIFIQDNNDCKETIEQSIVPDEMGCEIYIPNVFSPNFDGRNDIFKAFSRLDLLVLEMKIFNRWGALVFAAENFSTQDQFMGWDGRFKGEAVSTGVYAYYFKIKGESQDILLKGDVSVIK